MLPLVHSDEQDGYRPLVTALCERDAYTRSHCDRVVRLALELGEFLGLPDSDLACLRISAQLHDVGKIGIRDSILFKPGKLTPEEWESMKSHSELGERIIMATYLSNRNAVADVVRHHHESFDGSGYPDGLAGERIPLLSRILLIADGYDAMSTGQVYHGARTHGEAMAIMEWEQGRKIDPKIFQAFRVIIEKSPLRAGN